MIEVAGDGFFISSTFISPNFAVLTILPSQQNWWISTNWSISVETLRSASQQSIKQFIINKRDVLSLQNWFPHYSCYLQYVANARVTIWIKLTKFNNYASSNSYASFVLSKLPACLKSRWTYSWRMNQLFYNIVNPMENFFSRGICLLTSWACTIGIWSTLAQLNLITQIY